MGTPVSIGITYSGGSSVPTADPNNPSISPGETTITWSISSASESGTTFPTTGGIVFTPSWLTAGNSQPTFSAGSNTYSVLDSNNLTQHDAAVTFSYSVTVLSPGGTPHINGDPDVTNTPP